MTPFVLALALLVGADPLPATPAAPAAPQVPPGQVRIQVTWVAPSGAILPGGGAGVRIERQKAPRPGEMDEQPETVQAWAATAAEDGSASFDGLPPLGTAESDTAVVRWHGVDTRQPLSAGNDGRVEPLTIVVRDPTRDQSGLTLSLRIAFTPRDAGLQVEHLIQIDNATHEVVDTDQGEGLVLPIVTPAPFDEPVDGVLPLRPDPREFLTQESPEGAGRVLFEKGRVVYRGDVSPDGQVVRVVYMLPYDGETAHTYGLRLPLPAKDVALIERSPERVAPLVSFRAPSEAFVRGSGGGDERTAQLLVPPKAGAVVLIDVAGTPDRHVFFRPLAAGLGAIVVALLVLLAAGKKREA